MAPDASLVSVRVLDQYGSSRVSTVVHGLEWVIAHKDALGIRVVTLAPGAPAAGSYREEPLAAAAEMAWHSGLVVVVAAGNDGPASGSITTPGIDPLVLTVGAADDSGTPTTSDDVIPSWSSEGPTIDQLSKPDVVAPGRKIVSVRVPGSTIDLQLPTHVEGPETIRLSGTSEATAVAAGAATLLAAQGRQLGPDAIKALLVSNAVHLAGAGAKARLEDAGEYGKVADFRREHTHAVYTLEGAAVAIVNAHGKDGHPHGKIVAQRTKSAVRQCHRHRRRHVHVHDLARGEGCILGPYIGHHAHRQLCHRAVDGGDDAHQQELVELVRERVGEVVGVGEPRFGDAEGQRHRDRSPDSGQAGERRADGHDGGRPGEALLGDVDDGDLRAHGREDVRELGADVAAAENRQPLRHLVDAHHRVGRVVGDAGVLDDVRHHRARAGRDRSARNARCRRRPERRRR